MAKARNLAKAATKRFVKGANKEAKSVSTKSKVSDIRSHIEKLSGERKDCSTIWTLIKHESSIYKTDEEIKTLLKAKGYETLLGEIS
jgi:hypothetical protein